MSRVLIAGLGRVGFRTLLYLKNLARDAHFYAVDTDPSKLETARRLGNVEVYRYEPGIYGRLGRVVDLAVTALPSTTAFRAILELVGACVSVVDVSFIAEDPYTLEKVVEDCGSTLAVDAGFAPGYSNLVAGYAFHELGLKDTIEIAVGGIPDKPVPPIGYVVTWNPRDLLEEYKRPARYVENYEVKTVNPLNSVTNVEVRGLGVFEAFVSDGLRTMLRNIRARNMKELTIRWPGHLGAIKVLYDLGLLDTEDVDVGGVTVKPVDVTARVLEKRLFMRVGDMAVLQVRASNGANTYLETAILRGTPEDPATPVFTALVHAYTAKLVLDKRVKHGVIAPENLYKFKNEFEQFLKERGVNIVREFS